MFIVTACEIRKELKTCLDQTSHILSWMLATERTVFLHTHTNPARCTHLCNTQVTHMLT